VRWLHGSVAAHQEMEAKYGIPPYRWRAPALPNMHLRMPKSWNESALSLSLPYPLVGRTREVLRNMLRAMIPSREALMPQVIDALTQPLRNRKSIRKRSTQIETGLLQPIRGKFSSAVPGKRLDGWSAIGAALQRTEFAHMLTEPPPIRTRL